MQDDKQSVTKLAWRQAAVPRGILRSWQQSHRHSLDLFNLDFRIAFLESKKATVNDHVLGL
jgi:hypothetical protein